MILSVTLQHLGIQREKKHYFCDRSYKQGLPSWLDDLHLDLADFPVLALEGLCYQTKWPFIPCYLTVFGDNNTLWLMFGWDDCLFLQTCKEFFAPPVPEGVWQVLNLSLLVLVDVWNPKLSCQSRNGVHLLCWKSSWWVWRTCQGQLSWEQRLGINDECYFC